VKQGLQSPLEKSS